MIIRNHKIVLKDTSPSEMARFRQIMLDIWRQQIEDDKNAIEMENFIKRQYGSQEIPLPKYIDKLVPLEEISLRGKHFDEKYDYNYKPISVEILKGNYCKNYSYVCDAEMYNDKDETKNLLSGNDYEIDKEGNVTLKRRTKNNFDRLYKETKLIGKTNKGALGQLEGKNIIESDFNEIKFKNRIDLNSFFDLTIKIQYAYDREISALMVGKRTENLDDLRTETYDLLFVGLKHSKKDFSKDGTLEGYSNSLPKLMKNYGFNSTSTCLALGEKSYDIAGFYHTHPIEGPKPSGGYSKTSSGQTILSGDFYIYNDNNLPGYIKTDIGWSIVGPDGIGKIQFDPNLKIEILKK